MALNLYLLQRDGLLVTSTESLAAIRTLRAKRGILEVAVTLLDGPLLPAEADMLLVLKPTGKFDVDPAAWVEGFTFDSATQSYVGQLNLLTEAINELLGINEAETDDKESAPLMAELVWRHAAEDAYQRTQSVPFTVENNIWRGDEEPPLALGTGWDWLKERIVGGVVDEEAQTITLGEYVIVEGETADRPLLYRGETLLGYLQVFDVES